MHMLHVYARANTMWLQRVDNRLKFIMFQNLPIMLSGISFFFFLPIIPKIMLTAPIILQIMLIYLQIIIL